MTRRARNTEIDVQGVRCLHRAVAGVPHETVSLGRDRMLKILELAEEALLAREAKETEKSETGR